MTEPRPRRRAKAAAGPANVDFEAVQGGFDHRWVEWFLDFDLTGSTVTLQLRLADSTVAAPDMTLTADAPTYDDEAEEGGLTVTTSGNAPATPARTGDADSSVSIVIPASLANAAKSEAVWYVLVVVDGDGIATAYKTGKIPYNWKSSR